MTRLSRAAVRCRTSAPRGGDGAARGNGARDSIRSGPWQARHSGLFVSSAAMRARRVRLLARYKDAFDRDAEEALRVRSMVRAGLPDSVAYATAQAGEPAIGLVRQALAEADERGSSYPRRSAA